MIPSIYSNRPLIEAKDHHLKVKRTKIKIVALICGISALMALAVTFTVFFHGNTKVHNRNVVTYIRRHPKNINTLEHSDVFISVKTTAKNHQSRLEPVISTWYQMARDHTYFFTDQNDPKTEAKVDKGHLVVTNCGNSHSRQDLCCKMSMEFDAFLESNKK